MAQWIGVIISHTGSGRPDRTTAVTEDSWQWDTIIANDWTPCGPPRNSREEAESDAVSFWNERTVTDENGWVNWR